MKTFLAAILALTSFAYAQQSEFFFKQRAIMMAQLEYEKNLDLMLLDPTNCKVPLQKAERIRVLLANIKKLNKDGKFDHCREQRFIGRRKIIDDLRKQKRNITQIKTFDTQENALPVDGKKEVVSSDDVAEIETIIEPIDDTVLPESGTDLKNFGTPPSEPVILSGYAGVLYTSIPLSDETFSYINPKPYSHDYFRSKNLPSGLSVTDDRGVIFGVPKTPGYYTPQIEVGSWGAYGATTMVFRGPVRFHIFPTPKFTVLNPAQRIRETVISFSNDGAPFLDVTFEQQMKDGRVLKYSDGVRTLSGAKSGKYYFETKIHAIGESGAIGWDIGNHSTGGGISQGGKSGHRLTSSYAIRRSSMKNDYLKLKKGDIFMSAIDIDHKKIWYGVNGSWIGTQITNPENGENPFVNPEDFDKSFGITDSSSQYKVIDKNTEFRAFVEGFKGTHVTMNFGDQPWEYEPPQGFGGIPFSPPSEPIQNIWDSNTASDYIIMNPLFWKYDWSFIEGSLLGNGFYSNQSYTAGMGGDAMLAMSPKSKGRWQFEMRTTGWAEKSRVGIAPAGIDMKLLQKYGLGASGTGSIGLRRLDEASSKTGKGVIEVDGKIHYIDHYDEEAHFTFDCNFDEKSVSIYGNGVLLLKTELPENRSGKWAIATTVASTSVHLFTHPKSLKYPVRGAKEWVLDTDTCLNCSTQKPVIAEEKSVTCPEETIVQSGDKYSEENHGADFPHCTVPETSAGQIAVCEIPARQFACTDSSLGPKTHCSYYMDSYSTAERCAQECQASPERVKMVCGKRGDWTPSTK